MMRRMLVLGAVVALVAFGCGDDSSGTAGDDSGTGGVTVPPTSTTTPTGSTAPGSPVTVDVEAGDYFFESSMTTFEAGVEYQFVVHNPGTVDHEFMIIEPIEPGMMDMEEMDDMAVVVIEEDDLPPGGTTSVDVTFDQAYPEGTLELACHVGEHYQKGMHLPIVVEG